MINIENNKLTGEIPKEVNKLNYYKYFKIKN